MPYDRTYRGFPVIGGDFVIVTRPARRGRGRAWQTVHLANAIFHENVTFTHSGAPITFVGVAGGTNLSATTGTTLTGVHDVILSKPPPAATTVRSARGRS